MGRAELASGYSELDAFSQDLLEWIARRVQLEEGLYVSEIIKHSQIASPATLFKLLTRLKELGLISITEDSHDRRCRRVEITEASQLLFDRLSDLLRGKLALIVGSAK
jgi:DNA-binding MarR family transcriptional regulator